MQSQCWHDVQYSLCVASGKQRTDYYIVKYEHSIFHLQLLQNIGYISHIKIINSPQNNT